MQAVFLKEIKVFFGSVIGILTVLIFLLINALFIWIIPGEFNIIAGGYASLQPMFDLAPWVFLFLIPAVTMRMLSEENKTGTLEILLTKPITDLQLVMAKFLAGVYLAALSLVPTLLFVFALYFLAEPVGNIDTGSIAGSYIGLILLASVYVSIGIFASGLTGNQVVAFIYALILSFFVFTGFEFLSQLPVFSSVEYFIVSLGVNEHYKSISRGVIDSRDVIYFISVIAVFILMSKIKLEKRN